MTGINSPETVIFSARMSLRFFTLPRIRSPDHFDRISILPVKGDVFPGLL